MDIDEKMKELMEVFTKTGKALSEIVKRNEEFIAGEIKRVETAIRKASEVCSRKQMDRLRDVEGIYERRIKICDDKAASGLRDAKTKYDSQIRKAENLRSVMREILRECLETSEFVKCVADRTKDAVKERRRVTERMNETVKDAEVSAVEQLKEAVKCHADAKADALKSLQQILKDTKDCIL